MRLSNNTIEATGNSPVWFAEAVPLLLKMKLIKE
jgi:hypothetical protein